MAPTDWLRIRFVLRKLILLNLGAKDLNLGLIVMVAVIDMRTGAGSFADIWVVLEVGLFADYIVDKVSVTEVTDELTFKEWGLNTTHLQMPIL